MSIRPLEYAVETARGIAASTGLTAESCSRSHGSECTLCVDACPNEAILTGGEYQAPRINSQNCITCGACAAVCPTAAFHNMGSSPRQIVDAARCAGGDFQIRCSAISARADVSVRCLAGLHPETLVAASAAAGGEVTLSHADCATCPLHAGTLVERLTVATEALAQRVVVHPIRFLRDSTPTQDSRDPRYGKFGKRRGVHKPTDTQPVTPARITRRDLLFGLLASQRHKSTTDHAIIHAATAARAVYLEAVETPALPAPAAIAGCTGCKACSAVCPTQALGWASATTRDVLFVNAAACVACGECARVCPAHVLSTPDYRVRGERGHSVAVFSITDHTCETCSECSGPLEPGLSGLCQQCRVRHELATDIWAELGG